MSQCPYCNKGTVYYDAHAQAWKCTKCPATIPRATGKSNAESS